MGTEGLTNYEDAFRLAFSMLSSAESDEFGSPCANAENIILFLTDGNPTVGANTSSDLIRIIDELDRYDIKIFTYGLGSYVNTDILKAIACRYEGIFFLAEN